MSLERAIGPPTARNSIHSWLARRYRKPVTRLMAVCLGLLVSTTACVAESRESKQTSTTEALAPASEPNDGAPNGASSGEIPTTEFTLSEMSPAATPGDEEPAHRDIAEQLLAEGTVRDSRWRFFASQDDGRSCLRFELQGPIGSPGGAGGCDNDLPIDIAEYFGQGLRAVYGPVRGDAVLVRLEGEDGRTTDLEPFGSDTGLGRAFYLTFLPESYYLEAAFAYDSDGHELGMKEADGEAERILSGGG